MDCAEFVFVGSFQTTIPHRVEGNLMSDREIKDLLEIPVPRGDV